MSCLLSANLPQRLLALGILNSIDQSKVSWLQKLNFSPFMLKALSVCRPDQFQQLAALESLKVICGNAQLMADLFVNYDCNLQASNLFERTTKGVARIIQAAPPPPQQPYLAGATAQADSIRDTAVATLLLLLKTLDERAQPLKVQDLASAAL